MILITFILLLGTTIFYQNNTMIVNGMLLLSVHLLCCWPSYWQLAGFHCPLTMVYFLTYPWATTHNNAHPYPFQSFHFMPPLFLCVNTVCRFDLILYIHFFILHSQCILPSLWGSISGLHQIADIHYIEACDDETRHLGPRWGIFLHVY